MSSPALATAPTCRNPAVLILSVLLAVAATGWATTATKQNGPAAPPATPERTQAATVFVPVTVPVFVTTESQPSPPVEMVDVLVAARDLPVGTYLSKSELGKLITRKRVAKDSLPPLCVVNENDLYDQRLLRPFRKDEPLNPVALGKGSPLVQLPEGMDLVSLEISQDNAASGFIVPGSKIDISATTRSEGRLFAFPLLIDLLVLAVDANASDGAVNHLTFTVSFAATQEQALLLALAKQHGCHLDPLLRAPGKVIDVEYDMKKVKKLLQELPEPKKPESGQPDKSGKPDAAPPPLPAPRPKGEGQ